MADPHLHDVVLLRRPFGPWPETTMGAVVDVFGENAVLVEIVGPAGETLDLLTVAPDMVQVVETAAPPLAASR